MARHSTGDLADAQTGRALIAQARLAGLRSMVIADCGGLIRTIRIEPSCFDIERPDLDGVAFLDLWKELMCLSGASGSFAEIFLPTVRSWTEAGHQIRLWYLPQARIIGLAGEELTVRQIDLRFM